MQKTYLFYDIETTGLNKCFDQVLQFAAIRTDLELNELEQHEILIKLNPDVIPSPQAIIIHNITMEEMQAGICEYEAIKKIHQLMNQPGTISLGYNTLGFDDEFLRFSFYRNLLPPYTHQFANNCGRMDLYPMAVMYYLYKKAALTWPATFKLEDLIAENQLVEGNAHDAMIDVKATLELARRFIKYRDMWQYLCSYFNKDTDLTRITKLNEAIVVDGSYGAKNSYQVPVLALGSHNHYKNQTLWLRLDTEPEDNYVIRKKAGELNLLLPANKRFMQAINRERLELMRDNKKRFQEQPHILQEIANYHKEYTYPKIPNLDIDAALYQNGFPTDHELALCAEFHAAAIKDKIKIIDRITNPNLREQAIRLLGRNYLDYLPDQYAQEFTDYLDLIKENAAFVDYKNQLRLTPEAMQKEMAELKKSGELSERQMRALSLPVIL